MKLNMKSLQDNKGNVSVLMCVALVGLMAMTAYVIDIGQVYIEKERLTNGIDAAALAAALELPRDSVKATAVAREYLVKNNIDPNDAVIQIGLDNKSLEIHAMKAVTHLFANVFGTAQSQIDASNKVIVGALKTVTGGIRPFAVETFDYQYGDVVILKEGAGDGYHGNYGAVALGGNGLSVLRDNVINGYKGTLRIGDIINTEPGNMPNILITIRDLIIADASTFQNFNRNSPRIWTIPIVDVMAVDGSKPVTILAFAQFYIEDVNTRSGHAELTGRFLQYIGNGEIDLEAEDKGAYGVRLIK